MENRETNPLQWLAIAVVLAAGLMALFLALFAPYGTGYGMMGSGWGWSWAGFMVIPGVLLILVLLAALGAFPEQLAYRAPAALEALDAHYARGEISREDYIRMRGDLEGGAHKGSQ